MRSRFCSTMLGYHLRLAAIPAVYSTGKYTINVFANMIPLAYVPYPPNSCHRCCRPLEHTYLYLCILPLILLSSKPLLVSHSPAVHLFYGMFSSIISLSYQYLCLPFPSLVVLHLRRVSTHCHHPNCSVIYAAHNPHSLLYCLRYRVFFSSGVGRRRPPP